MPQVGWLTSSRSKVLFDDALAQALEDGEWEGMPYEVLVGIRSQVEQERPDGFSATQLLGCPRKSFLEAEEDFYVEPMSNFPAFRGTVIHDILDRAAPVGAVTEERVHRDHRGIIISGQPDTLRLSMRGRNRTKHLIRDWKSTKSLPRYDNAYTNHQQQINLYRWILGAYVSRGYRRGLTNSRMGVA